MAAKWSKFNLFCGFWLFTVCIVGNSFIHFADGGVKVIASSGKNKNNSRFDGRVIMIRLCELLLEPKGHIRGHGYIIEYPIIQEIAAVHPDTFLK